MFECILKLALILFAALENEMVFWVIQDLFKAACSTSRYLREPFGGAKFAVQKSTYVEMEWSR